MSGMDVRFRRGGAITQQRVDMLIGEGAAQPARRSPGCLGPGCVADRVDGWRVDGSTTHRAGSRSLPLAKRPCAWAPGPRQAPPPCPALPPPPRRSRDRTRLLGPWAAVHAWPPAFPQRSSSGQHSPADASGAALLFPSFLPFAQAPPACAAPSSGSSPPCPHPSIKSRRRAPHLPRSSSLPRPCTWCCGGGPTPRPTRWTLWWGCPKTCSRACPCCSGARCPRATSYPSGAPALAGGGCVSLVGRAEEDQPLS